MGRRFTVRGIDAFGKVRRSSPSPLSTRSLPSPPVFEGPDGQSASKRSMVD